VRALRLEKLLAQLPERSADRGLMECDTTSAGISCAVTGGWSSFSCDTSLLFRQTPPISASKGLVAANTMVLAPCCEVGRDGLFGLHVFRWNNARSGFCSVLHAEQLIGSGTGIGVQPAAGVAWILS